MRLKSLEIKGFKSFASETVIHFSENVIGIVGPNGSGKSNIVDAIRWVLGEQKSSQLRLDKMTSVIFNGTKKRKEAQVASVCLTFENTKQVLPTDFQTVAISRVLYRSGESEYRLNGVPCRLKDITNLLIDTGMGSDSYAIIALGMVDDLLSDREQARRRMFEQAAGISKYKARKLETQQKLEATSADLERVEDLLFEIEDNLKKLEKQAQRTQKFYELKSEYKQRSIELALHHLDQHKKNYTLCETQITACEDACRAVDVEITTIDAQIEALRKQHTDKETSLSEQQATVNQLVGRIRSRENEKQMLLQKWGFVEQECQRCRHEIARAQDKMVQLEKDIALFHTQWHDENLMVADLEHQLELARQALEKTRSDHNALKGNLDDFLKIQQSVEREIAELEKQRAIYQSQIENLHRDIERTHSDIRARREEMSGLEAVLLEKKNARAALHKKIEQLESAEAKRLADLADTENQIEALQKQIAGQHRLLDAKRNEYKLTKSMIENWEGFPESIKFLSQQKEWAKNCPLLSDLIYVKEDYRVAIENFLEPYLNYYVVPDAGAALQAIQLLGKSQRGRANFFLLDSFSEAHSPDAGLFKPATEGTIEALSLVEVEAKYRPVVAFLLENVLIAEKESGIEHLLQQLQQHLPQAILLTRSGSLTARRFIFSGGSVGLFEGKKIGRKKNLELLESEIRNLENTENQLNTKLQTLRAHLHSLRTADTRHSLQQEKDALNRVNQEWASLQARWENIGTFVANFDLKAGENHRLIGELQEKIADMEEQLAQKSAAAAQAKARLTSADGSFREVAEQLSWYSQQFNQKNIECIRQQNKVAALQQEIQFRDNQLSELRSQLLQNQSVLQTSEAEILSMKDEMARLEAQLIQDYQEKKHKEAQLNAAEQLWAAGRNEIHRLEDQQRAAYRRQQEVQAKLNAWKEKFQEVRFEITAIGERLRAEFGVSVNDIFQQEPDIACSLADLEKEVMQLKRRLDHYGEINPLAVEAYQEIRERYDSIAAQRNDIVAAKTSLLNTMTEIETTATARFLEAFGQVREHFIRVFQTLFSEGDTADLVLARPENPLESDINIIAKPQGKRPQHIAQLSGGEKTLTATALLFALYLLKPAPFCIFDEVDAPLDDANIEKFNLIIRKFSKDSQFIIVTHNKATMAAVDVIYGVYMPEEGVSAVTPVDFRTLQHEEGKFAAA